jgi:hypothetical protein
VVTVLQRAEDDRADHEGEYAAEQQTECQRHELTSPVGPIHHRTLGCPKCRDMTEHEPGPETRRRTHQVDGCASGGRHAEHRQGGQCGDDQQETDEPRDRAGERDQNDTDEGEGTSRRCGSEGSTLAHERPVLDDSIGDHTGRGAFRVDVL